MDMADGFNQMADKIDRISRRWDFDSAEMASAASLVAGAVSDAAREAAQSLGVQTNDDAVGKEYPVQDIVGQIHRVDPLGANEALETFDGRVVRQTKIHIPNIKRGELRLVFHEDGRDLSIELVFIDQVG